MDRSRRSRGSRDASPKPVRCTSPPRRRPGWGRLPGRGGRGLADGLSAGAAVMPVANWRNRVAVCRSRKGCRSSGSPPGSSRINKARSRTNSSGRAARALQMVFQPVFVRETVDAGRRRGFCGQLQRQRCAVPSFRRHATARRARSPSSAQHLASVVFQAGAGRDVPARHLLACPGRGHCRPPAANTSSNSASIIAARPLVCSGIVAVAGLVQLDRRQDWCSGCPELRRRGGRCQSTCSFRLPLRNPALSCAARLDPVADHHQGPRPGSVHPGFLQGRIRPG